MPHKRKLVPSLLGVGLLLATAFSYRSLINLSPASGLPNLPPGIEGAFFTPSQTTPDLIFGVFVLLLLGRRHRIAAVLGEGGGRWGAGCLIAFAAGLNLWSLYTGTPLLLVISLSLLVMGTGWWLGGARGFAALRMPALFLLLAYPIPALILNAWMFPQQLFVASVTADLLSLIGIPATARGDLIATPGRLFQVIESCAGTRSMITLLMAGMLYGELFYRSRLQVALIVLVSPFVGLLINQMRVLAITVVPGSEIADIHTLQGLASLVVGVLLLAAFDRILAVSLPPGPPQFGPMAIPAPRPGERPRFPSQRVGTLLGVLCAVGLGTALIQPWEPPQSNQPSIFQFPYKVKEFRSRGADIDHEYLGSIRLDQFIARSYETETGSVTLFLASDDLLDPRTSIISKKVAMPGSGARILESGRITIPFGGKTADYYVVEQQGKRTLVYHWYENADSWPVELLRSILSLDRSPLRRSERISTVRVSVPLGNEPHARQIAAGKIDDFLEAMKHRLDDVGVL